MNVPKNKIDKMATTKNKKSHKTHKSNVYLKTFCFHADDHC